MAKLTPVQERVKALLLAGHDAITQHGSAVYIDGKWRCNLPTMEVLQRHGIAERCGFFCWRATAKAKAEAGK